MDAERKIFANTLILVSGQVVVQLANFGLVILLARRFGAATLGVYSLGMAIGAIIGVIVGMGLHSLATREISRDPGLDRELVGGALLLQLSTGIAMLAILASVLMSGSEDPATGAILVVVASFHVLQAWTSLLQSRYRARQSMKFVALVQAATRIAIFSLALIVAYHVGDPLLTLASLPASALIMLILTYYCGGRQYGALAYSISATQLFSMLARAWPLMSILLLAVIYERLGLVILRFFHPDSVVGNYASAERLLVPFSAAITALVASILPALAAATTRPDAAFATLARRFLRVLFAVLMPSATLIFLFREEIIGLLYGREFVVAVEVLAILTWVIALRGFNAYCSMVSVTVDLERRLGRIKLGALSGFVLLCILLVPDFGGRGLACAVLVADAGLAILLFGVMKRERIIPEMAPILWRPVICCLIVIGVMLLAGALPLGLRLALTVAVLVPAALATGTVTRQDIRFFRQVLQGQFGKTPT